MVCVTQLHQYTIKVEANDCSNMSGDEELDDDDNDDGPPPLYDPQMPSTLGTPRGDNSGAFSVDSNWCMPRSKKYEKYLLTLMQFVHGRESPYQKGTTFTRDQLLELKPEHIHQWLCMKAYKKRHPNTEPGGDHPKYLRSSTLEQCKKGVSFFMPNNHPAWCDGRGNPTKCSLLSKLIKDVKLAEVRGLGKRSSANRARTITEYKKELEMFRRYGMYW